MPSFVNAFERKPLKFGKYHVKLNGNKDVITYYEFDRMMERYDEVLWLDEDAVEVPTLPVNIKPISLIEQIKSGKLADKHSIQLSNLFGIQKGEKIKKKIVQNSN